MSAPLRHPVAATRTDPLAAFRLRCRARAYLWAACEWGRCECPLAEAVDPLQRDAERGGLITRIGQDAVQRLMRDAFHRVQGAS